MVAKTIHITEEQAQWLDANAFNVSRLARRIITKLMKDEEMLSAFIGIKTKAR